MLSEALCAQIDDILNDGQSWMKARERCGETSCYRPLNLPRVEFALLEFFMRNPKQVFSPESLINRVWPSESETSPEAVRTYIKGLRSKIDVEGRHSFIRNIHGIGYSFEV